MSTFKVCFLMTQYFFVTFSSVNSKIIPSHIETNKKSSPLTNPDKPNKNMNKHLFEQVVYIPPNSLKMKNRKNKFASFSGRSV